MPVQLIIELPEGAFSALRKKPADFGREMLLAAAVKWYELGVLSQSKAAEIAGLTRGEFLRSMERFDVSPFQTSPQELVEELEEVEEVGH